MAVKFFKRGPHYEGAVQREQYILETLGADPKNNIGEFDELDRGTNFPYLNRAHYSFSNQIFRLIPEGSNYQEVLGGFDIAVQPIVDDCE